MVKNACLLAVHAPREEPGTPAPVNGLIPLREPAEAPHRISAEDLTAYDRSNLQR